MNGSALIALDTSTDYCSVALYIAAADAAMPARVFVRHELTGVASSGRVLPAVRETLDEAGVSLQDCVAVAFGAGPGSFTGVRTATGIAQGLAFALGIPTVPVSTLAACAESARMREPLTTRVLAALDARMNEVYWAEYEWDAAVADWRECQPPALCAPETVPLPSLPFTLAGNAIEVFGARLTVGKAASAIDSIARPHAAAVAALGWRAWQAGRGVDAAQAAPLYVRDKVALTTAERVAGRRSLAATAAQTSVQTAAHAASTPD